MSLETHPLRRLFTLTRARTKRISSWDRTGGNMDFVTVQPGSTLTLAEITGPGCITQIYCGLANSDPYDYRDAVLRMYWDGETAPSVEVPLGDFFGVPFCRPMVFTSLLATVNPGAAGSHGLTSYFPMPFATGARITIEQQGTHHLGGVIGALWYRVEYEELPEPPGPDVGRFHAQWRRENLTRSVSARHTNVQLWGGKNIAAADNYVILDARGRGQLVGVHLQIDNVAGGWYGEGDDMLFIDGEQWPPSLHGTGTEEIVSGGACPDAAYAGPYAGYHYIENLGGEKWGGKNALYRWHVHDPVHFAESLRFTLEHGHANNFENDYCSVAYWYQAEPHAAFPALPDVAARRPRVPEGFDECREVLVRVTFEHMEKFRTLPPKERGLAFQRVSEAYDAMYRGDVVGTRKILETLK